MILTLFAAAETATHKAAEGAEASAGILDALGVNPRLLVLQTVAFLLLVWALGKWVYPVFIGALDKRQEEIEAGLQASKEAQKAAESAADQVKQRLADARKQANDILAATQKEATQIVASAEEKAARRAEHITQQAAEDMQNQLRAARRELAAETRTLVAQATEQIIKQKLDPKQDAELIDQALQRAKQKV
ncbi:ATP synthase F0 subunit B [Candidatus Saccharibacteria bacterium]|nr:MAG: ATP synthase F0 subunit B [Candidatus Saccharibacteria bacterium]